MIHDSVVRFGGTPSDCLATPGLPFTLYGKMEGLNPGGSAKARPAALMLRSAIARGEVGRGTTVVESSSGNMAIGLAQACASLGLPLICVIDAKATPQHRKLLAAYGATIDVVNADPATGDLLAARIARVMAPSRSMTTLHKPYANSRTRGPPADRAIFDDRADYRSAQPARAARPRVQRLPGSDRHADRVDRRGRGRKRISGTPAAPHQVTARHAPALVQWRASPPLYLIKRCRYRAEHPRRDLVACERSSAEGRHPDARLRAILPIRVNDTSIPSTRTSGPDHFGDVAHL
jgi:hypothetical protein